MRTVHGPPGGGRLSFRRRIVGGARSTPADRRFDPATPNGTSTAASLQPSAAGESNVGESPEALIVDGHPIDARWRRRNTLGLSIAVVWLVASMVVVAVGCITHLGPFGWLASGELALLGTENPVLTAIPMYLLLLGLPWFAMKTIPRDLRRPLVCGAQQAIDPQRKPVVPRLPGSARRNARWGRNAALGVVVLLLVGGAVGFEVIAHSGPPAGQPLPVMAFDTLRTAAALPPQAQIVGAEAHVDAMWVHRHSVRQTSYRDDYVPLTARGWRPGDPVWLIEVDKHVVGESSDADVPDVPDAGTPREGTLSRDAPDAWIVGELRTHGLNVVDHPVLLDREALGGVEPGPDLTSAWLLLTLSVMLAMFAGLIAWSANRRMRMFEVD